MRILAFAVFAAVTSLPAAALADQCAWMSKDQAREATHFAEKGLKFVDLCEPCGDKLEKVSISTIDSAAARQTADGVHHELVINGEPKDVAYVFVETVTGSGEFENLASLAKCDATDVSPKINVIAKPKPAKTPVKNRITPKNKSN
jgi:hypothetical protein